MSVDLADMSARDVIERLGMEYLEGEGCWIAPIWRTANANAIYALITPDDFSALHRFDQDEAWTFVVGDPVELLVLSNGGSHSVVTLGTKVDDGQVPHHLVPAGCWQGALTCGAWCLVTCVVAPPFCGFELATNSSDLAAWSDARVWIAARMRS